MSGAWRVNPNCVDEVYRGNTYVGHFPDPRDARAVVEAMNTRGGWRPIESAPKDGTRFLATHIKSGVQQISWFGKTSHVPLYGWAHGEDAEDVDLWEPTHWQPLPAPPTDDAGGR